MNKLLSLFVVLSGLLFYSCSKSSGTTSAEDARDPGVFSYEIITPTPNDPRGVFQIANDELVRGTVKIRLFIEDNFIKLTARCTSDSGAFYLNLHSPIELETITEESGRKIFRASFLKETRASFSQGEMTCRFGFNSGDRLEFFLNNLNGAILEVPSSALSVRIERQIGNQIQVSETVENLNNNPFVKISD